MKETEKLFKSLTDVEDTLIEEAQETGRKRRSPGWVRWGAAAASVALVLAGTLLLPHRGGPGKNPEQDVGDTLPMEMAVLEWNGACYEICDIDWVLQKYGLPERLSPELAGERIGYLELQDGGCYKGVPHETGITLHRYAPAPQGGAYILRDGNRTAAVLFCNFIVPHDASMPFFELYRAYGVEQAEDIVSVAEVKGWDKTVTVREETTDPGALAAFYRMTADPELLSWSNDEFQEEMFGGTPEEQQPQKHTDFADDCRQLRIETKEGQRFFVTVFPRYRWLYGGGTLSYYRVDEALSAWLEENLDVR